MVSIKGSKVLLFVLWRHHSLCTLDTGAFLIGQNSLNLDSIDDVTCKQAWSVLKGTGRSKWCPYKPGSVVVVLVDCINCIYIYIYISAVVYGGVHRHTGAVLRVVRRPPLPSPGVRGMSNGRVPARHVRTRLSKRWIVASAWSSGNGALPRGGGIQLSSPRLMLVLLFLLEEIL